MKDPERVGLRERERRRAMRRSLLGWYVRNGRRLPWRGIRDPYRILVSEIMLQQTQVRRVLWKYRDFLRLFPDFRSLARARRSQVIRAWQGMGYNNRALRLHRLARTVVEEYDGKLPEAVEDLRKLPGIGSYTAHAVACFAFGAKVPVVDTNVARVLGRLYPAALKGWHTGDDKRVWRRAVRLLPRVAAARWNQALMDLGSLVCTARNPRCIVCPLRALCPSAHRTQRAMTAHPKREPGRDGIPNRIYRGRVVETLRRLNGRSTVGFARLQAAVKPHRSKGDNEWFLGLLEGLQRDGLIAVRGPRENLRIALPD